MNNLLPITSAQNEQLHKLVKLLKQKKEREQQQSIVLEGIHLINAYLEQNRAESVRVFIHEDKLLHPEIQSLIAHHTFNKCYLIHNKAFARLHDNSSVQDILAIVPLPQSTRLPCQDSCVLLENVQDAGNVGTILRSTAAAGIRHVLLNNGCADVYSPKVLRAAMGAHFLLNLATDVNLIDFIEHFQGDSLATALNPRAKSLFETKMSGQIALIMGNEGSGVSPPLQRLATHCLHIPMQGQTESLNVAMAATVCLFERVRQLTQ